MIVAVLTLTLAQVTALSCPPQPLARPSTTPEGRIAFRSYGAGQGLDDLAANVIAEDGDGFLWVGTQSGGVFRYDGVRWKGYGRDDGLPSDLVRTVAVSPDGVVIVGTAAGLAVRTGDRFHAVGVAEGLTSPLVTAIAFDSERRLWVGTSGGLFRGDGSGRLTLVDGWAGRGVTALFADRDGSVFIGEAGALTRLARDGQVKRWGRGEGLDGTLIIGVVRDGRGRLWIKSLDSLKRLDDAGRAFADFSCLLRARGRDAPLSVDHAGNLLVPTGEGLVRVRGDSVELIDSARGLPTAFANYAFEDREGSLWVASVGVHKALGRGLWGVFSVADGLPNDIVWAIARAPDGTLYAGTESGLARAGARGWETVAGTRGLTFGALRFLPDGTLWSTGSTAGLVRIDPTTGAITRFDAASGLVTGDITLQLAITRAGEYFVSTRKNGLFRGDRASGRLRFAPLPLPGGDAAERVNDIVEDGDGRVWLAGAHGLVVRDGGQLRRFTTRDGLADNAIGGIVARRDGELCVNYRGHEGITCFRYAPFDKLRTGGAGLLAVHAVDAHQGRRAVVFLGEDAAGRLWAGTAMGVSVIDARGIDVFGTADGAPGDDCAELAFFAEADGGVWIGTSTGLGRFDGRAYAGPPRPPNAAVIAARFGNHDLLAAQRGGVRYGEGTLAIHYAALSFVNESRIGYETRLIGADDTWRATDLAQAQYGALAPGAYRFEVRARIGAGAPGKVASLPLRVLPAWWQSWWFRALVAGALLGLAAAAVRRRVRALAARNVELEMMVEARTADLKRAHEKIAEGEKLSALGRLLAQLSHELNNPVNVISNNVAPIREYVKDLVAALLECRTLAQSFPEGRARVDELWESLELDFKVEDIDSAVRVVALAADRISAVHGDLRTFMQNAQAQKTAGDVTQPLRETVEMMRRTVPREVVIVEDYDELPAVPFDRGRMNQVFLNLIKNAAEAVGTKGEIVVATRRLDGAIEISVTDTGPGVPPAVRPRIFEPFFTTKDVGSGGTGLGLAICRRIIVDDHRGVLELDERHAGGARFNVRLPVESADGPHGLAPASAQDAT